MAQSVQCNAFMTTQLLTRDKRLTIENNLCEIKKKNNTKQKKIEQQKNGSKVWILRIVLKLCHKVQMNWKWH